VYLIWKRRELKGYWCNVCFKRDTKRRYSLIPVIVRTHRVGGEPWQVHVGRLPSIRSCCLQNESVCAQWWEKADETLNQLLTRRQRPRKGEGLTRADARRIRLKLAEVRACAEQRAHGPGWQQHTQGERTWRHTTFGATHNEPPWYLDQHLQVLGLSWPCRLDQVKAAFRTLAKKHHPDHGGKASDFRVIHEAYRRLLMSVS
jgi:hypothetical protein